MSEAADFFGVPHLSGECVSSTEESVVMGCYPEAHEISPGLWLGNERHAGIVFPFEAEDKVLINQIRDRLKEENIHAYSPRA